MGSYLLVFAITAIVTFAVTPLVRALSSGLGWIDRPSDRKMHPKPTPTAGGIGIWIGLSAGLIASRFVPFLRNLFDTGSDLDAVAIAGTAIVVLGVIDDTRGVSALGKLAGQVLIAGVLVLIGVQFIWFYFPGQGLLSLSPDIAVPLTIIWVVLMVNAVNLIDGLDGLAAGIVAIAAIAFFAYIAWSPQGNAIEASSAALLAVIAAGAAIGFLPWNFYPAKIFMGDSGALLLGLVLAVATISGAVRNLNGPPEETSGALAAIVIPITLPLLVLSIALLDVVLAVIRRMRRGIGIGHADKEHIHHRLMDIGHTHRQAVLLMYLWSALISGSALVIAFIDGTLMVGAIVGAAVIVAAVLPRLIRDRSPRGSDRPLEGNGAGTPVTAVAARADRPPPRPARRDRAPGAS
ncbi:MAG TPA: MraY family glycosyltransferase [Actinomycetota bacterium]|nr:MraY family glycosyltransferase [Actinomycetota bacterium]